MVGDGDTMGVAGKVAEHVLGAAERWFGVNHPLFAKQRPEPGGEELRLSERSQIARKVQLPSQKGRLESVDKLPAKYTPESGVSGSRYAER